MREDTVVQLRQPGSFEDDPLTEVLRLGARRLLGQAVEAEVAGFVEAYAHLTGSAGRRRIVRHGHLPEREIQTGIGPVAVRCPRVRDRGAGETGPRIRFTSRILPPYLRRAKSIEELLPWLYLKGISTGDFCEALEAGALGLDHCPPQGGLARRAGALATARSLGQAGPTASTSHHGSPTSNACPSVHEPGAAGDRRRLPERPVLARSAARSQAPRPGDCARAGHRRRGARFLESLARGLRDDARAALLGAQDRQRLNKLPKSVQPRAKQHLQDIWMAETRAVAEKAFDSSSRPMAPSTTKRWPAWPRTATSRRLRPSTGSTFAHQSHRTFATVRLRTTKTKGCLSRMTALTMVFKLCQSASKKWRRLDGSHQIADIIQGVKFKDGEKLTERAA